MAQLTPVVKWLLILNLGIFFADLLIFENELIEFGEFTIASALGEGRWYEFITFQFLHANLGHVVFNCVGLFFFGPWMERWWGAGKFIAFYLICGAAGAVSFTLLVKAGVLPQGVPVRLEDGSVVLSSAIQPLVGASAGIYGILIGVAMIAPSMRVRLLLPPVTLTMRNLALILLGISVASVIFKFGGNEGGEVGHLGGAIMGFILIKGWLWYQNGDMKSPFGGSGGPRTDIAPKIHPRTRVDLSGDSEVDRLLDKISKDGFQSLTDEERDTLQRAAKSQEK